MSKPVAYGTPVVIHDGAGRYREGLVFASRTDLGGADDSAPITAIALNPKFAPVGAARGNVIDAVEVLHDLAFIDDPGQVGYSFRLFEGEEPIIAEKKKAVLPVPVVVPPPVAVTDSTGVQEAPQPIAIVGGMPVAVRSIGDGVETHEPEPEKSTEPVVSEPHSGATVPPQEDHRSS